MYFIVTVPMGFFYDSGEPRRQETAPSGFRLTARMEREAVWLARALGERSAEDEQVGGGREVPVKGEMMIYLVEW